jgi:trehalose-6-phosphatase
MYFVRASYLYPDLGSQSQPEPEPKQELLVQPAHMIFRYDGTLQWRFDRTIQRPPHANVGRAVRNLAEGVVSGVSGRSIGVQ